MNKNLVDEEIFNNLKSLQNQVNEISKKVNQKIPTYDNTSSNTENSNSYIKFDYHNYIVILYLLVPISIAASLHSLKPYFIMEEVKIANSFFTKKELSYMLLCAYTVGITLFIFLLYFVYQSNGNLPISQNP